MIDYSAIEDDIVTRLTATILATPNPAIEIVPMPETEAQFLRTMQKSRITVGYRESKFKEPSRMGGIQQEETLCFDIIVQSKFLRGSNGVYDISVKLRTVLLGYEPINCTQIIFIDNGRTIDEKTFEKGVWTHLLNVSCRSYAIQVEDITNDPLFTQVDLDINIGPIDIPKL